MDPQAAFEAMAQAVGDANWQEAKEHARNLLRWFDQFGFPPTITGVKVFDSYAARAVCEKIVHW